MTRSAPAGISPYSRTIRASRRPLLRVGGGHGGPHPLVELLPEGLDQPLLLLAHARIALCEQDLPVTGLHAQELDLNSSKLAGRCRTHLPAGRPIMSRAGSCRRSFGVCARARRRRREALRAARLRTRLPDGPAPARTRPPDRRPRPARAARPEPPPPRSRLARRAASSGSAPERQLGGQDGRVGTARAVGGPAGIALALDLHEPVAVEEEVGALLAVASGDHHHRRARSRGCAGPAPPRRSRRPLRPEPRPPPGSA